MDTLHFAKLNSFASRQFSISPYLLEMIYCLTVYVIQVLYAPILSL